MNEISDLALKNLTINSCGPHVHSYYMIDNQYFSQEGPLKGRARFLRDAAIQSLSRNNISKNDSSILDVGAYDGWILNQISQKGFKNLVGLEPRSSNIERGSVIRKLLN